jgi:predicted methyltransferase
MLRRTCAALAILAFAPLAPAAPPAADHALAAAIAAPARSAEHRARDVYRHPLQTLRFFGIRPDLTVVEIWPSSGWYTEILAPYLHDQGQYYAAGAAATLPTASEETRRDAAAFQARLDADPARYGKVVVTEFRPPLRTEICPPGSADLVLTFRNVHNWMAGGYEQEAFNAFYAALKPGGILGVVEHRAKPYTTREQTRKSGYVNEAYVRSLAQNAGFRFVAASPVNNNPKDTKDYPEGVWTLPPTYELGEKNKAKYKAIGESDRMTLKFEKPLE